MKRKRIAKNLAIFKNRGQRTARPGDLQPNPDRCRGETQNSGWSASRDRKKRDPRLGANRYELPRSCGDTRLPTERRDVMKRGVIVGLGAIVDLDPPIATHEDQFLGGDERESP